jgi:hypothetical protein
MREKDELNKRLIKANHDKLLNPEGTSSCNGSPESDESLKRLRKSILCICGTAV